MNEKKPYCKLLKSDVNAGTFQAEFDLHTAAYILQGILERVGKFERMPTPRPTDDEVSYQFTRLMLEEFEYCRNSALKE